MYERARRAYLGYSARSNCQLLAPAAQLFDPTPGARAVVYTTLHYTGVHISVRAELALPLQAGSDLPQPYTSPPATACSGSASAGSPSSFHHSFFFLPFPWLRFLLRELAISILFFFYIGPVPFARNQAACHCLPACLPRTSTASSSVMAVGETFERGAVGWLAGSRRDRFQADSARCFR